MQEAKQEEKRRPFHLQTGILKVKKACTSPGTDAEVGGSGGSPPNPFSPICSTQIRSSGSYAEKKPVETQWDKHGT